jgi:hypothetical protein
MALSFEVEMLTYGTDQVFLFRVRVAVHGQNFLDTSARGSFADEYDPMDGLTDDFFNLFWGVPISGNEAPQTREAETCAIGLSPRLPHDPYSMRQAGRVPIHRGPPQRECGLVENEGIA